MTILLKDLPEFCRAVKTAMESDQSKASNSHQGSKLHALRRLHVAAVLS